MELQMIPLLKYKIISEIGKKIILPIFLNCISDITNKLFILKKKSNEYNIYFKDEFENSDLEYKISIIGIFLKELSEEKYNSYTIHANLCGIYEILENIKIELTIINDEYEYIITSWYYYVVGWTYFKSKINFNNLKIQINLLNNRYNMLLKLLMINKI